jgi:hypothetical protein
MQKNALIIVQNIFPHILTYYQMATLYTSSNEGLERYMDLALLVRSNKLQYRISHWQEHTPNPVVRVFNAKLDRIIALLNKEQP